MLVCVSKIVLAMWVVPCMLAVVLEMLGMTPTIRHVALSLFSPHGDMHLPSFQLPDDGYRSELMGDHFHGSSHHAYV